MAEPPLPIFNTFSRTASANIKDFKTIMNSATEAVTNTLRPSERVTLVIDTSASSSGSTITSGSTASTLRNTRRVLAIITHQENGKEQGGCVHLPR